MALGVNTVIYLVVIGQFERQLLLQGTYHVQRYWFQTWFLCIWLHCCTYFLRSLSLGPNAVKYLADIEIQSVTATADWVLIQLPAEVVTTHG